MSNEKDFELKTKVGEDTWRIFTQLAALLDRSAAEYLRRLVEDHCYGQQRRLHVLTLTAEATQCLGSNKSICSQTGPKRVTRRSIA